MRGMAEFTQEILIIVQNNFSPIKYKIYCTLMTDVSPSVLFSILEVFAKIVDDFYSQFVMKLVLDF